MDDLLSAEDLFEASGRYGYQHPGYAEAYVEVGEVRHLRRSGAWMLTREIATSGRRDALVGHPLTVCRDWSALSGDLAETAALTDVVTVSASSDPLGSVREETLRQAFPDLVRVHAQHYIAELAAFWPNRDHRREVRRAMQLVDVDIEESPTDRIDDWATLSGDLRGLAGMGSIELSRAALERELGVPGCVSLTALAEDGPVAMAMAYVSGDVAHLHAVVSTVRGEQLGARYALFQAAVEDMAGRGLYALDLGTATPDERSTAEAEKRFMDGWTELLRPSYQCGRIVDRVAYDELCAAAGTVGSATFPAYRDPTARLGPDMSALGAVPHDNTQGEA